MLIQYISYFVGQFTRVVNSIHNIQPVSDNCHCRGTNTTDIHTQRKSLTIPLYSGDTPIVVDPLPSFFEETFKQFLLKSG